MNGLDQVVIALWFLPVVLFIIIPLCVGTFWLPIWLLYRLIRQEPEPLRRLGTAVS